MVVNSVTNAEVAAPTPVNTPVAIWLLLELSWSLMAVTAESSCA